MPRCGASVDVGLEVVDGVVLELEVLRVFVTRGALHVLARRLGLLHGALHDFLGRLAAAFLAGLFYLRVVKLRGRAGVLVTRVRQGGHANSQGESREHRPEEGRRREGTRVFRIRHVHKTPWLQSSMYGDCVKRLPAWTRYASYLFCATRSVIGRVAPQPAPWRSAARQ